MSFNAILYEVEDNILTITLNRPDQLNAFNGEMMRDLFRAFDQSDADDDVRAVIMTGAGRGFCAGADLSAGAEIFPNASDEEVAEAALQFVRKVSGYRIPAQRNEEAFNEAVDGVSEATRRLLASLQNR